jgi:hypothetical protein
MKQVENKDNEAFYVIIHVFWFFGILYILCLVFFFFTTGITYHVLYIKFDVFIGPIYFLYTLLGM